MLVVLSSSSFELIVRLDFFLVRVLLLFLLVVFPAGDSFNSISPVVMSPVTFDTRNFDFDDLGILRTCSDDDDMIDSCSGMGQKIVPANSLPVHTLHFITVLKSIQKTSFLLPIAKSLGSRALCLIHTRLHDPSKGITNWEGNTCSQTS
jgi:hypothetical protein